jgi:hypothetical protein
VAQPPNPIAPSKITAAGTIFVTDADITHSSQWLTSETTQAEHCCSNNPDSVRLCVGRDEWISGIAAEDRESPQPARRLLQDQCDEMCLTDSMTTPLSNQNTGTDSAIKPLRIRIVTMSMGVD